MRIDAELVSQTIQGEEEYLNFDLDMEKVYPTRIRIEEDHLEVLVGESFDDWENDYISRKRLNTDWENSFYIEEDMDIGELKENYGELFERYSDQVTGMIENRKDVDSLNQVKAALD